MGWVVNTNPMPFYPRERAGTYFIGAWVNPWAGLYRYENLGHIGIRSPNRPARSESLYQLSYPSSLYAICVSAFISVFNQIDAHNLYHNKF